MERIILYFVIFEIFMVQENRTNLKYFENLGQRIIKYIKDERQIKVFFLEVGILVVEQREIKESKM